MALLLASLAPHAALEHTLGQQYNSPRLESGRIDIPTLKATLVATNSNSFSPILEYADDYLDFVEFLAATANWSVGGRQFRAWVTLFSPSHSCHPGTWVGNHCAQSVPRDSPLTPFNETALFNATLCPVVSNATTTLGCHDYRGWASLLGRLRQQYPHLAAVHLDDFSDESNLAGGCDKHGMPPGCGSYTPELLADMRSRLGGVQLVGGLYWTRHALNRSFTLDVYPWLASSVDGMMLYFLNSKQGFGPCVPSCPGMPTNASKPGWQKFCQCCLAGTCAEATAPNAVDELADVAGRLSADQSLSILIFSAGSSCGHPSDAYTLKVLQAVLPLSRRNQLDGAMIYTLTNCSAPANASFRGCMIADEYAQYSQLA